MRSELSRRLDSLLTGTMRYASVAGGTRLFVVALVLCSCGNPEQLPPAMSRLTARPQQYSAAAVRARVVDDRTGEPIQGAVVLALWRTIDVYRLTFGGVYVHYEATTDRRGAFEIPRWGPRTLNYDYYLDARDPEIWIIKRGYLVGYFDNTGALDPRALKAMGMTRTVGISKLPPRFSQLETERYARSADAGSIWNNTTVPLRRASSAEEEASALGLITPLDPHESSRIQINRFWEEWTAARDALPGMLRKGLEEPPLPLSQRRRAH
jgi:hypothetical protein